MSELYYLPQNTKLRVTKRYNLPEDVVVEILSRLAVKNLLRLRCVCKSWRSLISNPHLAKLQLERNINNPNHNDSFVTHNFHAYSGSHKLYVINKNVLDKARMLNLPLPTSTSRDRFCLVGSCNGLLCLAYPGNRNKKRQSRLLVWNPVTEQMKDIHNNIGNCIRRVSLGFGFDNANSDYKVVSIVTDRNYLVTRVNMYSLNQNSWKGINHAELMKFRLLPSSPPAILKDSFYWLTTDNSDPHQFGLVSINLQSGKLCTISLPRGILYCQKIFNYKQSVAISTAGCPYRGIGITIWTLVDDNCWIKMLTMKSSTLEIRSIVGCLNMGEFVGETTSDEIVLCDPVNNVIKYTHLHKCTLRAYNYTASLVNLN